MSERRWDDERWENDAPLGMSMEEARAWAWGWNAAVREACKQADEAWRRETGHEPEGL